MGLLGKAVRTSVRTTRGVTRTSYRAGRSVARGRVPSVSIGGSIMGIGGRIGTRGIGLSTPVARVKAGPGGFRIGTGIGPVGGSIRPLKPSANIYVGPLALHLAKRSGIFLNTDLFSIGFVARPLIRQRIGERSLAIPGRLAEPGERWHERIDDVWRPHYQRRPPSFLAELHDVITGVESDAIRAAFMTTSPLIRPEVNLAILDSKEISDDLKQRRKTYRSGISFWRRAERREAKARAVTEHVTWIQDTNTQRQLAADELQARVDRLSLIHI